MLADVRQSEIAARLREVNERLAELGPAILANLDAPLAEGEWTVHEALCHLAADSNWVPRILQRRDLALAGKPRHVRPDFDLDDYNRRQIAIRLVRPPEEVLAEAIRGHQAAGEALLQVDDESMRVEIPDEPFSPLTTVGELLRVAVWEHARDHLKEIEEALKLRCR
jgi:hypothetical protein